MNSSPALDDLLDHLLDDLLETDRTKGMPE
jgi:hypothetical protein